MKRLSLQWRITLMTALLICSTCVLMNCLVGYSGMRYMDSIGAEASAHSKVEAASPSSFDPTNKELDDALTIVVNDAQESFGATSWYITAAVTLLGGVLAYFVSGHALRPLRFFATQVESVRPDNLAGTKISEDVPSELRRCSASFNDMITRLDEGFSAQRQFTGNAAHELRTPLALMQAQVELFCAEHPDVDADTASLLGLLQEQTERMTHMTKTLLEMSELRSVPCNDAIDLAPMIEEVLTDLAPLAEQKGHRARKRGRRANDRQRHADLSAAVQLGRKRHSLQHAQLDRANQRPRRGRPCTATGARPGTGHSRAIPDEHLSALLSRRQIAQQGIWRRGAGACTGLGDCRTPRRLHRGRRELGARNDHARDSSHSRTRLIKITNGMARRVAYHPAHNIEDVTKGLSLCHIC